MTENPRIDELRRRVEKDPSSIAFAQLGEEYRRMGDYVQAVKVCRDGLGRHPGYLSAHVTLGRALMELGNDDEACVELEAVLNVAPDNLAAIRALADIHQRRGEPSERVAVHDAAVRARLSAEASAKPEGSAVRKEEIAPPHDVPAIDVPDPVALSLDVPMPALDGASNHTEAAAEALPSLDTATLDLPPMPDFSNWDLDTEGALDLPAPSFVDPPVEEFRAHAPGDPVLEELEDWLAAIVSDRSRQR